MITFFIENKSGERSPLEVPTDMGLSLMEVLKAADYPIEATCGGMALCATCHIEVLEGDDFKQATEAEYAMLDTLPVVSESSRLACQMRLTDGMDGLVIRLMAEE